MKKKISMLLLVAGLAALTGCAGRAYYVSGPPAPHAYWVPGHYEVGPYGGQHWVAGHWR
jgi:hypothetical protein